MWLFDDVKCALRKIKDGFEYQYIEYPSEGGKINEEDEKCN